MEQLGADQALINAGDLAAACEVCAAGLARFHDAGDLQAEEQLLPHMVLLDLHAGRIQDAAAHLRDGLQIGLRAGDRGGLLNCLDCCGYLCAATGRPAETITMWAASAALYGQDGGVETPVDLRRRDAPLRAARQALGPDRARAAEDRGAAMSLDTAAEYALLLTTDPRPPAVP